LILHTRTVATPGDAVEEGSLIAQHMTRQKHALQWSADITKLMLAHQFIDSEMSTPKRRGTLCP
jgi:hypothetical protein